MKSEYLAGMLALLLLLLSSSSSRAADDIAVAVTLSPGQEALAQRIDAELREIGFHVVEIVEHEPQTAPLDVLARQAGVIAAIRVVNAQDGIEVWTADRLTGKTSFRRLTPAGNTSGGSADIALETVELLRASLLELGTDEGRHGEVLASPRARSLAVRLAGADDSRPTRGSLGVGVGILGSLGGVPVEEQFRLHLDLALSRRFQGTIVALAPLTPARISQPEGTATVATSLVGASIEWVWGGPDTAWRWSAGPGFGVLWLQMQGAGVSPLTGLAASAVTVAPYVRTEVSRRLHGRFRMALGGLAGYALAQPIVRFVDREVAVFGRPTMGAQVSVLAGWP